MSDVRCRSCKHCDYHPEYERGDMPFEDTPEDWRFCLRTVREWWGDPRPAGAEMMVLGYEFDGLATAPEFGCVQHAPREDDTP